MNNVTARLNYENAQAALYSSFSNTPGFDLRNFKITQSFLRLEADLVTGNTQYQFNVLVNQPGTKNTEQRLNLQDSFVISQVALMLGKPSGTTDAGFIPQTYPDAAEFTNADEYKKLYNGAALKFTVNNDILIPSWDTLRHYYVPQTQAQAGPPAFVNEVDFSEQPFYPMEPNIILVGSKNNVIQLNLAEGLTAVDANSRVILMLRGHLIQNSTVVS